MRIIKNGCGYELIQLDKKLWNGVLTNLRKRNLRLMKTCITDAKKLLNWAPESEVQGNIAHIAIALFDKLATKSYTVMSQAETRVVHEIKEAWKMERNMKERNDMQQEELAKCEAEADYTRDGEQTGQPANPSHDFGGGV